MTKRRPLLPLLVPAFVFLAACADLLGVVPLSGSDASPPPAPEGGGAPEGGIGLDAGVGGEGGCTVTWVAASGGAVPAGAVPNPVPNSVVEIYVCRASSPTLGVVPGKLLPAYGCYYGDGQQTEILAPDYEVFVPQSCAVAWNPAPNGVAPVKAVAAGHTPDGGLLYSCRVEPIGADPGEIGHMGWSTNHVCVYSLSGSSLTEANFDVLTAQ